MRSPAARPDVVVLAGYMRVVGPLVLAALSRAGSSTPIRRCCPRSPAPTRCATRSPTASRVTGVTVHLVDETLDGGPIVAQEAVPVAARRRRGDPARPDPGGRASPAAAGRRAAPRGRGRGRADGRHVEHRPRAGRTRRSRDRAAPSCRSPTRPGLVDLGPRSRRRTGSSSSRPAARRGRCAMPACRSRTSRRSPGSPGDARRPGQDAPSADPRRPARRPPARRPSPPAAGRRHRPVRARRRQPLSVRGRARAARDHGRRADRGDRHRRPVDGPRGGQEPRQRRDRHVAGALRRRPRRARHATPASTTDSAASSRSRRSPTRPPTTPGSPRSSRGASSPPGCSTRPRIRIRRR